MCYIPPSPSNIFEMFSNPEIMIINQPKLKLIIYDIVTDPGFHYEYEDKLKLKIQVAE